MARWRVDVVELATDRVDVSLLGVEANSKASLWPWHLCFLNKLGHPSLLHHTFKYPIRDVLVFKDTSEDEDSLRDTFVPLELGVDNFRLLAEVYLSNDSWVEIVPHVPSADLSFATTWEKSKEVVCVLRR